MQMQRNKEEPFLTQSRENIFQELFNYIDKFDKNWKERIKPASNSSIESLKSVAEIQKWCSDFPESYRIFLETMGENDGGLLSKSLIGTSNIMEIIDLYEEFHKFYPNVFDVPYFTFFQNEMGNELAFDLSAMGKCNILETDCGEVIHVYSESFEKLLFQSAFNSFERFNTYIEVSGSSHQLKKKICNLEDEAIYDIMEELAMQWGLKKVWFSDKNHYIAVGAETGLYMEREAGMHGFVTSNHTKLAKELAKELTKRIGTDIYYPQSNI